MLELTWLGQSGFVLASDDMTVLVDPWLSADPQRRRKPPTRSAIPAIVDVVLATHGHADHLDLDGLLALTATHELRLVVVPTPLVELTHRALPEIPVAGVRPGDLLSHPISVRVVPAWHAVSVADRYGDGLRGDGSTHHVGYVISLGGNTIYHAGDTIADEQLTTAVAALCPDIALLPVNGRDPAREAAGLVGNLQPDEAVHFAMEIGAHLLVPMHYDGVIGNTGDIGEVARATERMGGPHMLVLAHQVPLRIPPLQPRASRPTARQRSWSVAAPGHKVCSEGEKQRGRPDDSMPRGAEG